METFDYVIVGAGTAGCVVANRLSADGRTRVLLLEAGGTDRRMWIQLPIGYGRLLFNPAINWMYETESEPALGGRTSFWPRGKVIGGSGSINAMVHVRGQPGDFDDWAAMGNPGWSYRDVLPFFKKSEDHDAEPSDYHGRGGPMHVTDISAKAHPLCALYIETCQALGFHHTTDFNGAEGEGVGIYQINTRNGLRASTANEFLRPALQRANLTLRARAHATRLLFKERRATGVEYLHRGQRTEVAAGKEVILCGGAINSPQVLQLSGIGDAELLGPLGIEIVVDSKAVGRNLQDHLAVSYFYKSARPTLNDELYPLTGKIKVAIRYLLTRTGPLSMSVNQGGGFVRSDAGQKAPNLQLYFNAVSYTKTPLSERKLLSPDPFPAFLLSFNSCRPTSRGFLRITSPDPMVAPTIWPNYLSTEKDIAEVLAGCRLLRKLAATRPLSEVITGEILPGGAIQSDGDLITDFRTRADTVFHPVSTCMMGPDPRHAVVDARLRVHGALNLRVIDSSVFPTVTSGNTNAPTVMVAEKGAAMLIEDARQRRGRLESTKPD
jgi:choline dehydrogenase